jgi:VanZ family protein
MMKNIKRITALYILLILLIIAAANQGDLHFLRIIVNSIPYGDKWGHFFLMGLLAFFVNMLIKCKTFRLFNISILKGSVIVFSLITLEELSQLFIKSRSFDLGDLTFDYLGILVFGQLAVYLYRQKMANKE